MLGGGVLGLMFAHADERQLDLQRGGADQAGELVLGLDLLGHQIEQADAKRSYILSVGGATSHDLYTLAAQDLKGGKRGGRRIGMGCFVLLAFESR